MEAAAMQVVRTLGLARLWSAVRGSYRRWPRLANCAAIIPAACAVLWIVPRRQRVSPTYLPASPPKAPLSGRARSVRQETTVNASPVLGLT